MNWNFDTFIKNLMSVSMLFLLTGVESGGLHAQIDVRTHFQSGMKWVIKRNVKIQGDVILEGDRQTQERSVSSEVLLHFVRKFKDVEEGIPQLITQNYVFGKRTRTDRSQATTTEDVHPLKGGSISFRWQPDEKYYVVDDFSDKFSRSSIKKEVSMLQVFQRFLPMREVRVNASWESRFPLPAKLFLRKGETAPQRVPLQVRRGQITLRKVRSDEKPSQALFSFQFPVKKQKETIQADEKTDIQGDLVFDLKKEAPERLSMMLRRDGTFYRKELGKDLTLTVKDFRFAFEQTYNPSSAEFSD